MMLNYYANACHNANMKWWQDPRTGLEIKRNRAELLALVHTEISEYWEGETNSLMDDKLPHRSMGEVELADAAIRLFDYAAGFGYDLNRAGLRIGVSEFEDLRHLGNCAQITPSDRYKLRGHTDTATAFIHWQISRIVEHERKGRQSEAEMAIALCIAFIAYRASAKGYDLQSAYAEKMGYNATRKDHTHEARLVADGKQF